METTVSYFVNAYETNKLTQASIKKNNEQQLEHLLERIRNRAMEGYFSLTLWAPIISSENKRFLEMNGYKI